MPLRRLIPGLAVALLCLPPAARAILIDTGKTRVGGYFVRDDGVKLTIRVRTADGQEKINEYDHAKIKILHQLDRKRLESLSRDDPKAYHDYADELARQEADPEATDMAMRLFLLAAYLDPQEFGPGSLLSMSRLAGTPAEARRCRALAFLLDPKGDVNLLKADAAKPAQLTEVPAGALQDFLQALEAYRTGQIKSAKLLAARDGVDRAFGLAPGGIDKKAFLQLCTDAVCPLCKMKGKVRCSECNGTGAVRNDFGGFQRCPTCNGKKTVTCTACEGTGVNLVVPDDVLRPLLRDELWAVEQLAGADARGKRGGGQAKWSSLLRARQVGPVLPLSLETITELDPRKCLYRNGAWVAP